MVGTRWPALAAAAVVVAVSVVGSAQQESPVYKSAEVDVKPKILEKRLPLAEAPSALYTASFVVDFVIEADGTAPNLCVSSAPLPEPYTEEYLSLLRRWRFEPGRKGGVPVRVATRLTVSVESVPGGGRGNALVRPGKWKTSWLLEGVDDDFGGGAVRLPAPGVTMPRVVKEVRPAYSPEAMRARVTGMVDVEVVVGTNGKVAGARVVRSADPRLETGAISSAKQWEFSPAMMDGQPVPVIITLSLEFR